MKIHILLFWFVGNWGRWGQGRTYQKVAEHLSELPDVERVVCVFPPIRHRNPGLRAPLQQQRLSPKLMLVSQNQPMIAIPGLPYKIASKINEFSDRWTIRLYLQSLGFRMDNTILWLFPPHPYMQHIRNIIPHQLGVVHVVDNFTKLTDDPWLSRCAAEQYPVLKREADIILTGSSYNQEIFSEGRNQTYLFENAVDEIFLGKPKYPMWKIEARSPRLGYVGTISQRTDLDLLEYTARTRPDWEIIIAGHTEIPLEGHPLLILPNIRYLGVLPYQDLPNFLDSLDVCLIPHRDSEYCRSMSPLKLYQYLASGCPIVSTKVDNLGGLKNYVALADDYDTFVTTIDRILCEDTIEQSALRIAKAREEVWDVRVAQMFDVVKQRFDEIRCQ